MKIQSLSIVVPNKKCLNKCKFCVSRMHESDQYENMLHDQNLYWDLYEKDYVNRLAFARENHCNTVMLTGDSEPQQNRNFLKMFGSLNRSLPDPFRWIEMQTTGAMIDNAYLYFLRHHVGVSTISLSVSSFNNKMNQKYNGTPDKFRVDIEELCRAIKKYRFNLRLSVNLTNLFDDFPISALFDFCKKIYNADQVTFRVLYESEDTVDNKEINEWIREHRAKEETVDGIREYIKKEGRILERLEFGAWKVSVSGMGTVIDEDCMSTAGDKQALKYLILRPDCKLYTKWDDPASLLF